jgi:hypothetical protein
MHSLFTIQNLSTCPFHNTTKNYEWFAPIKTMHVNNGEGGGGEVCGGRNKQMFVIQ